MIEPHSFMHSSPLHTNERVFNDERWLMVVLVVSSS
jgi:hypothetical protein